MAPVWARLRAHRPTGDAGTTLMELIVGMVLMAIFMAMFTGAIVAMTSTANKVEAVTIATSQTNQAFLTLDKQVRYAVVITPPGQSTISGDWYVEYEYAKSDPASPTVTYTCAQLRVDQSSQQLQERTGAPGASTPSAWIPLASNIVNGAATAGSTTVPFTVPVPASGASTTFQRLSITLVATAGSSSPSTTQSQVTFTALNSTAPLPRATTACKRQWARP